MYIPCAHDRSLAHSLALCRGKKRQRCFSAATYPDSLLGSPEVATLFVRVVLDGRTVNINGGVYVARARRSGEGGGGG